MERWGDGFYLRGSQGRRYARTAGWALGIQLAAIADRRSRDHSNFTVHHGAIVARFGKKRLRTVRTIFWSKIGVSTLAKPL
jgi:hypothetical protein